MPKLITAIILLLIPYQLLAQTITGYVYEEGTAKAIANASIYYSGSTTGAMSDNVGLFHVQSKSSQVPLIISCVGYYSAEVTNYKPGELLKIYLKPKLLELQGVTIKYDGMSREEKVRIFTREFIGTSKYAQSCTITNIDDVDLYYNIKTKTLTAECSKPIRIQNKMLGYGISYYLDRFKYSPQGVQYAGNSMFRDIPLLSADKSIKRNRENAFDGSRMQLIRLLWSGELQNSGFKIYDNTYRPLSRDSIVVSDSLQEKYLSLTNRVWIAQQTGKGLAGSWLTPVVRLSFINKEGFYGLGVRWGGQLARQRIGDMLPFEYQSVKELKQVQQFTENDKQIAQAFGRDAETGTTSSVHGKVTAEQQQFKTIVLGEGFMGLPALVRKWTEPIYYKVYGATGFGKYDVTLNSHINRFFARLATLTGLTIKPATDSAVNFNIVLGNIEDFKDKLTPEVIAYFEANPNNTGYYTYNDEGFTSMTQRVFLDNLTQSLVWLQVRIQILNGLGFIGTFKKTKRSLFFYEPYYWTPDKEMEPLDEQIIKMLYLPAIKSGMQVAELDAVLKSKDEQPAGTKK